ncbi:MAG: tRNA (adenosine(37)-N6)-threonylcarbamoyltransferase complex dimerization subunit type 1 TsaB [Kofleriaceae bacterium]
MPILALDTSTLTGSAAVVADDGALVAVAGGAPGQRSDGILDLARQALAAAGTDRAALTAIAVGAGPGSFTGLRIGLASGKGLAYALGVPLWLASSLAALAWDLAAVVDDADPLLVPVLDARRGEVYAGFYRRRGPALVAVADEQVLAPGALAQLLAARADRAHLGGDALTVHAAALAALPPTAHRHLDAPATPSAHGVARAALTGDRIDRTRDGAPTYVRPSEAEVKYPDGVPGALAQPPAAG